MTYEELLIKINKISLVTANLFGWQVNKKESNALRAVVDMHKPFNVGTDKEQCSRCMDINTSNGVVYEMSPYPCETIKAIEKELA
jgi:CDP-diacylglycerol pyrophosphatase